MSSHFNMPEFDHKAFAKFLAENKLTPSSKLHSLNEGIEEAVPFEKDALDEIIPGEIPEEVMKIYNQEIGKGNFQFSIADAFEKAGKSADKNLTDKIKQSFMFQVTGGRKGKPGLGESEELEEMANFFTITQDQKDKLDPEKYTGAKKLVAQALKGDEVEVGQPFTKATIKAIIGKDPLKDFNAVLDAEKIGGLGKTSDIRPEEPKTPGVRGRKPGTSSTAKKEPSMSMSKDKVVGVRDIDGPRAADVTAAEKELGGAKGIDRTIAIDKAGKAIIAKLKDSKEQLKDPKFKEAKRLAFIAYLTRPKSEGGKIGLRKGGETYNNLLDVWDNTVEDLIS